MHDDAFADDGGNAAYTLVIKAESDQEALTAFDTNAGTAPSRLSIRAVPGHAERVLTVEFDLGAGSEWELDVEAFRSPVERRLNEWFLRDIHDCREGVGYPMGSLLWWGRIGPEAV